jgi:hypothetical protein
MECTPRHKVFCFMVFAYGDLTGMNPVDHVGDWRYLNDGHPKHTPESVASTSGQRGGTRRIRKCLRLCNTQRQDLTYIDSAAAAGGSLPSPQTPGIRSTNLVG